MDKAYGRLDEIIKSRLSRIVDLASRIPKSHPVPIVKWFGRELGRNGALFGVSYDPNLRPREGRLDIDACNTRCNILMSHGLLDLFLNFERYFSEKELYGAIDNFIVHEIVHRAQGMGDGNHRGLSAVAPNVLAELDYEADASAVLILFTMDMIEGWTDDNFRRVAENSRKKWAHYAEVIRTTLSQIHIFSLMDQGDQPICPDSAAQMNMYVRRWERICIWHMQYHRAAVFEHSRPISDLQLLHRPVIGFRNQNRAFNQRKLVEAWPSIERQDPKFDTGRPTVAISVLSPNGVRRHVRHTDDATRDDYEKLFRGIFRCSVDFSEPFFVPLLNANFGFVGKSQSPPPPPPPSPPPAGPLGDAMSTFSIGEPVFYGSDQIDVEKFLEREFAANNAIADVVAVSLLYEPIFKDSPPDNVKAVDDAYLVHTYHARALVSAIKGGTSNNT